MFENKSTQTFSYFAGDAAVFMCSYGFNLYKIRRNTKNRKN